MIFFLEFFFGIFIIFFILLVLFLVVLNLIGDNLRLRGISISSLIFFKKCNYSIIINGKNNVFKVYIKKF